MMIDLIQFWYLVFKLHHEKCAEAAYNMSMFFQAIAQQSG